MFQFLYPEWVITILKTTVSQLSDWASQDLPISFFITRSSDFHPIECLSSVLCCVPCCTDNHYQNSCISVSGMILNWPRVSEWSMILSILQNKMASWIGLKRFSIPFLSSAILAEKFGPKKYLACLRMALVVSNTHTRMFGGSGKYNIRLNRAGGAGPTTPTLGLVGPKILSFMVRAL